MNSNQKLAEIHFMYGKADGNAALARRLYKERYPQRLCPDRKTFVRLHYRLYEYGKFNSPGLRRGRPRSTTPEVQEEILEAVNMTPSINTRRLALQVNVPHTTVWRLLKEYQLYPYHLQSVQALSPADYPARVRFCQWFLQQCGVNPNFPALILFTDEAQFTRNGITNFHNQHVWAYENPRATVPSHHQVRFSLNMWAEDTPLINRQHIHFLHDGAPANFSRTARRYLDRRFPDRWIDRVPDLESLRNRIVVCSEGIRNTPGVWDRVRRSMRHRCENDVACSKYSTNCISLRKTQKSQGLRKRTLSDLCDVELNRNNVKIMNLDITVKVLGSVPSCSDPNVRNSEGSAVSDTFIKYIEMTTNQAIEQGTSVKRRKKKLDLESAGHIADEVRQNKAERRAQSRSERNMFSTIESSDANFWKTVGGLKHLTSLKLNKSHNTINYWVGSDPTSPYKLAPLFESRIGNPFVVLKYEHEIESSQRTPMTSSDTRNKNPKVSSLDFALATSPVPDVVDNGRNLLIKPCPNCQDIMGRFIGTYCKPTKNSD
ncbi:hypothetical protein ANN_13182 [Periplaneta americana]|uniref:DUF4817 domain-containing protein n=1 Tax=Periplaneta americana TaxID=6978 RepID=A0ABQ8TIP7_PERAM|nr:hypothetical protein ANN_13182 [Periplaneta americana]